MKNIPMLLPNMRYQKLTHMTRPTGRGKLMSLAVDELSVDDEVDICM